MADKPVVAQDPSRADEDSGENPAIMIFSAPVVRQLSTKACRLEPTYVGVRRVRPSSRVVQKALQLTAQEERGAAAEEENASSTKSTDAQTQTPKGENGELPAATSNGDHPISSSSKISNIVFKVVGEDGVERRMTKKEKRALKQQVREEKALAKKQRQELQQRQEQEEVVTKKKNKKRPRTEEVGATTCGDEDKTVAPMLKTTTLEEGRSASHQEQQQEESFKSKGSELEDDGNEPGLNADSWIQQELADLKGERLGVPPVILSPPLAQVIPRGILGSPKKQTALMRTDSTVRIDDDLARDWATALKESMVPAEQTRQKEDMRSMVYHLIPEVWTRFRPESLISSGKALAIKDDESELVLSSHSIKENLGGVTNDCNDKDTEGNDDTTWRSVCIRPLSRSSFDADLHAVVRLLHQDTTLHVSCGAKFGCDLLLYDGPRNERHAFAGLRVISADDKSVITASNSNSSSNARTNDGKAATFPLLTAYCLAGYVRCLNKAAKLALLATVQRVKQPDDGSTICRVAFVDMKLERVDGTKKKDLEVRLQKLQKAAST